MMSHIPYVRIVIYWCAQFVAIQTIVQAMWRYIINRDEKEIAGPKLWHVHSSSELAELQRTDPDIGPVDELRIQFEEQPSFDTIRYRSVNTKIH